MITPDANIILYAYNEAAEKHLAAKKWLFDQLTGPMLFGLSWHIITAFLRISTNPRVFPRPLDRNQAISVVDKWFECSNVEILTPTARHWSIFRELISDGQTTGPLMMDAHLATLAIEHDAVLATTDRDFSRFSAVKTVNPLK